VVPTNPDLLIVGTGANEVKFGNSINLQEFRLRMEGYLRSAREYGADVIAIDTQFYPAFEEAVRQTSRALAAATRSAAVNFFPREFMMRGWANRGEYTTRQVHWQDDFHMLDLSYNEWAEVFAWAVMFATRPDDEGGTRISVHQGLSEIVRSAAPAVSPDYGAANTPSRTSYQLYYAPVGTPTTLSTSFVGTGIRLCAVGGPWYEGATFEVRVDGGAWAALPNALCM